MSDTRWEEENQILYQTISKELETHLSSSLFLSHAANPLLVLGSGVLK